MFVFARPLQRLHRLDRRFALKAGLALGAGLVLPSARACEFFTTTLRVTHPWTRASRAGAESAVVCMVFDQVTSDDRLVAASSPVAASARMGGALERPGVDFAIPRDRETLLSESGTFLQLVGLQHPLEPARAYPLTLVFEKGGSIETDLTIDYLA